MRRDRSVDAPVGPVLSGAALMPASSSMFAEGYAPAGPSSNRSKSPSILVRRNPRRSNRARLRSFEELIVAIALASGCRERRYASASLSARLPTPRPRHSAEMIRLTSHRAAATLSKRTIPQAACSPHSAMSTIRSGSDKAPANQRRCSATEMGSLLRDTDRTSGSLRQASITTPSSLVAGLTVTCIQKTSHRVGIAHFPMERVRARPPEKPPEPIA